MIYENRTKQELIKTLRERDKQLALYRTKIQKKNHEQELIDKKIGRIIKMMQSFTNNRSSTKLYPQNRRNKKA